MSQFPARKATLLGGIAVCLAAVVVGCVFLVQMLLASDRQTAATPSQASASSAREPASDANAASSVDSAISSAVSSALQSASSQSATTSATAALSTKTLTYTDNGALLHNPLMGWQYYAFPDEIINQGAPDQFDVIDLMVSWDKIEPAQGEYHFDEIDKAIRILRNEGKTVYLRLYCMPDDVWNIMGLPGWLFSQVRVPYQQTEGNLHATQKYKFKHPLYYNSSYQMQLSAFINEVASHFTDGTVDVIDMRCYGIYGEWDSGWLPFDWGGDTTLKQKTLNQLITIYQKAFANHQYTKIAINIPGSTRTDYDAYLQEGAFDTALGAGFAIRFDGIGDTYNPNSFAPQLLASVPKTPVFAETYYGYNDQQHSVSRTIKAFLMAHSNAMTFGFYKGNISGMLQNHSEEFNDALMKMGYRLLPETVRYTDRVRSGGTFEVDTKWSNLGVGSTVFQYPLAVELVNAQGATVYKDIDFSFDLSGLTAGDSYSAASVFQLPGTAYLPRGKYQAVLSLVNKNLQPAIELPIGSDSTAKKYKLGQVTIE